MKNIRHSATAVLIGAFILILLNPTVVGFYSFTIFFKALSTELGWGRGVLGLAITIGTLTIAVVAPILGGFADRGGARKMVMFASVGLAVLLASMPVLCKSLPGLYLAFSLIGVLTAFYYVSLPRIISSWFDGRRGLALGFVMSGTGLGAAITAPIVASMIESSGWPSAYMTLAAIVFVVAFPTAYLLVRDGPNSVAARESVTGDKPKIKAELVLLAIAMFLMGLGLHGILIHFSPILTDRGISAAEAAGIFALASGAMFVGRIACGFLFDKMPANRVGALVILCAATGVALLYYGDNKSTLMLGAVLFGLGVSAELDLISFIVSRTYPITHFSRFFSFVYASFMVGTAFGPPVLGVLYDKLGNHQIGTLGSAVIVAASALALAAMKRTPTSVDQAAGKMVLGTS